jgi:hypothetical protein
LSVPPKQNRVLYAIVLITAFSRLPLYSATT